MSFDEAYSEGRKSRTAAASILNISPFRNHLESHKSASALLLQISAKLLPSAKDPRQSGTDPMAKPGRPSSASLSVVSPVPEQPPQPPESLSPEAAAIWREILGTVHFGQFRGAEFLLEEFCRTVAFERQLGREVEALPPGKARDETARARRAEAEATKLRLSPRSRVDKNIRLRTVPPGRKPWEIDAPPDAS